MFGPSQSMGYDRSTVMYSPEGRIIQTEYAREAMKRGTIALGIKSSKGVVLAGLLRTVDLNEPDAKVHKIDEHIKVVFSGYAADGRILIQRSRVEAQVFRLTYQEPIDVLGLSTRIGDLGQAYTQSGGVRPFGVGLIFGGVDVEGPALHFVDPGGGVFSCKAKAIGEGDQEAIEHLKTNYDPDLTLEAMVQLAKDTIRQVAGAEITDEEIDVDTIPIDVF